MPSLVIFTIKSIELSTFNILLKGILWFVISEILFISKKYCLGVFNCSWPDRTSLRFSVKVTICFNVLTVSLFVDEKAKLPMFGTIESLNVSVACGAFLYEAVRQRM